ncbi:MAG: D-alanyl-D-alanine carboxypeptidase/D-alanyl-D-alanine-endopeptidase [bacterium]
MKLRQLFIFLFILASVRVLTGTPASDIGTILTDPILKGTSVAIVISDLDSGEALYELNPAKSFIPASNMKLVTAAAAIVALGPSKRITTDILADAFKPETGAVYNILIRGHGDPTMSENFFSSNREAIDKLAGEMFLNGIRTIKGNIILDSSYFPTDGYPTGWNAEDTYYCYAPRNSALTIAANCLKLTVSADKDNKNVNVDFDPPLSSTAVRVNIQRVWRGKSSITIGEGADGKFTISGRIRVGQSVSREYPVKNPVMFFGSALESSLKRAGIAFQGKLINAANWKGDRSNFRLLFQFYSPDLMEILTEMQHESDNFVAEQLLRMTGAEEAGKGTPAAGATEAEKILHRYKMATAQNLSIYDGSGLSRLNRLAPQVLIKILKTFYYSQQRENFMATLAAPGEKGTMEKRLTGTSAVGRLRAKTGALRGACALSGYYRRPNGNTAAFVMLFNGYTVHSNHIRELQDKIVKIMMEL